MGEQFVLYLRQVKITPNKFVLKSGEIAKFVDQLEKVRIDSDECLFI